MRSMSFIQPKTRHTIAFLYGFIGWLTAITGWGYLPWTRGPAELPAGLVFSTQLFPLWVWGALWSAAGLLGIAAAVTQLRRRWFAASMASMTFVHMLWFAFYAWSYFAGDHRAYVQAVAYLRPALLLIILGILIALLRPKVSR